MMTFPIYGKIIQMFQTTNQLRLLRLLNNGYDILWWFDNYSAILWDIMIYRIYQQLNIMDVHIAHINRIYIYIYGCNYLTICDVHIISKIHSWFTKNRSSARFGMPEWSAWMEHRPVLLVQTCDTHSQYLNQTKVYCTKYEGFNVTYFLIKKTPVHQQLIGLKPVDYDEFFGAPQYGHQPSLAMGSTLNQHDKNVPRPRLIRNTPYP